MLLAIEMASRHYSTEEVVGLLEGDMKEDIDDPQEVVMEGSDEEFEEDLEDLDQTEDGTYINTILPQCYEHTLIMQT